MAMAPVGAGLAAVLVPRPIAHSVHPVLDGPVTANQEQQGRFHHRFRRHPCDAVGLLAAGVALTRCVTRHMARQACWAKGTWRAFDLVYITRMGC